MRIFVIYKNPSDHPGKFVVRGWDVNGFGLVADGAAVTVADSLGQAREHIPEGFFNIGRYKADDPAVFEVWL